MSKINRFLLILVVVLVLVLVGVLLNRQGFFQKSIYAVYLETGDLYFGELSRFPTLRLKNAYLLVRDSNNQQNPYSLQKFSDAFWQPQDVLKINPDRIIWIAKLKTASQLTSLIREGPASNLSAPTVPQATSTNELGQ